jgi:glycosyltransferase involved in cell wall biosynthesis
MNRLLVIAYYTPPLGLSGVMRVTKLCKFLPEFGWQPVIVTVKPVAYYAQDPALLADLQRAQIVRTESLDPNRLLNLAQRLIGGRSKADGKSRLPRRVSGRWLNYLLLPDAKAGWLPFAIRAGSKAIQKFSPRAIFATAPPWTALLAGVRLSAQSGLPLIADFRDPYPAGFQLPPVYQRPMLKKILRKIFSRAQQVLAVNPGTAAGIKMLLKPEPGPAVEILENGFDPDDFAVPAERLPGFSLLYAGNLFASREQLAGMLTALARVPEVKFYLAGDVDLKSRELLGSSRQVVLLGRVEHSRVCALMKGADCLLYIGKPQQPVGLKLYEYLGACRPVIVWGKENAEAAALVQEFAAGVACTDAESFQRAIAEVQRQPERFVRVSRDRLNRRLQAQRLAELLNRITINRT